jgi:hypothetical protein
MSDMEMMLHTGLLFKKCAEYFHDLILDSLPVDNCVIAGGAVAAKITGSFTSNDLDLWFRNSTDLDSALVHLVDSGRVAEVVSETENAHRIRLSGGLTLDLIKLHYPDTDTILRGFDFCHLMLAVEKGQRCEMRGWVSAPGVLRNNELVFNLKARQMSLERLIKYANRGFSMGAIEEYKFIQAIRNTPNEQIFSKDYSSFLEGCCNGAFPNGSGGES